MIKLELPLTSQWGGKMVLSLHYIISFLYKDHMENFNAKEYRDNLAKDLKEIRKTDPEKAQQVLNEKQQTTLYKKAETIQKEDRKEKEIEACLQKILRNKQKNEANYPIKDVYYSLVDFKIHNDKTFVLSKRSTAEGVRASFTWHDDGNATKWNKYIDVSVLDNKNREELVTIDSIKFLEQLTASYNSWHPRTSFKAAAPVKILSIEEDLDMKIIKITVETDDFEKSSKEIILSKGKDGVIRKTDPEKAQEMLAKEQGIEEYQEALDVKQNLRVVDYTDDVGSLVQDEIENERKQFDKQNLPQTKIDFYDNNKNFIDSLKKALENIDFKGLENIALVNIDGIGVDKTESLVRKDSNKEFIIYSFQSEDKLKSDNPKVALLLAKDNVKFLRLPFTPDDLIRTINSEVIETKDSEQNLQEIQDKEILNKTSYLLHKIHISSIEQFDTLPENEARNLPSLISEAKEYFPALENKTDREIVEFLLQIRQNVPEVMKGQNIEGVYCDIEGTLFNGEELNQNTLNTLKDLESQGKNITLWTDGDTNQLQKLLDKNGITYPLKSKIDHAGASAEIVIDNDDQNTFSAKTKIFAKKFINL
jgi:hypothetical protein